MLFTGHVKAQKPSCDSDSYSSEVLKETQISEMCIEYEIKVSYDGTRSFGLSHYSMAIPCGEIKNVSNSENWKQVFGKDPTTGVYGLKIDDISGFGEGGAESFTVKFTWCSDNSCEKELGVVSYKAGKCVDYDTLASNGNDPGGVDPEDPGGVDPEDPGGVDPEDPGGVDPGEDTTATQTCSSLLASLTKKNVTCFNGTDGQVDVVIQEGKEPLTYSWSNGATTASAQNLSQGSYSVTITDADGNMLTLNETITSPPSIAIVETIKNPSCGGIANGSIELAVTGGSGVYTFAWSTGSIEQNVTNLTSGWHVVTVTDAVGCSLQKAFFLANSVQISATVSLRHTACTQITGSINITPSGGVAPYTYLWNTGATTEDLLNIAAGDYTVKITDAVGCTLDKKYTVRINNTLAITFVVAPSNCFGDTPGAVDVSVFGGTAPYTFLWADGPTTEDRSGLALGLYSLTVTDATGCTLESSVSIYPKPLVVNSEINQPTCAGTLGSISLTPEGTPPYTYVWDNGETGDSIDNLTPGFYSVTVTDGTGCSRALYFAILNPLAMDVTSTVSNTQCGADGAYAVDLMVTGGQPSYTFLWSNGATTQNVTGLSEGTYSVAIKDAIGCSVTKEFVLNPVSLEWTCLIAEPTAPVTCGSAGNMISTSVDGATSYSWTVTSSDNSWIITSGGNDSSAYYTAGTAGSTATFTLTMTKNGCTQTCSYTTSGNCVEKDNTGGGDPSSSDPCVNTPSTAAATETTPAEEPGEEVIANAPVEPFKIDVYPNPFKETLNFKWTANHNDHVKIEILDRFGNRVALLYEGSVVAGEIYHFDWTASGCKDHNIYFYRYTSSTDVDYGKLLRK